jgi:hypothetical protein
MVSDIFRLDKHIPQWNTQILVTKFVPDQNRKNVKGAAQGKNGKYKDLTIYRSEIFAFI